MPKKTNPFDDSIEEAEHINREHIRCNQLISETNIEYS